MLFKILHGDRAGISTDVTPFHEGWCYVTHDGCFYVDLNIGTPESPNNQRIKLNAKDAETLPTCLLAGHQGIQGLDTSFVRIQISITKRKRMKTEPEDARVNTQWSAPVCSAIKTNSNYTLVWYLLHFRNFYSALCPFPSITSQVLI